MKTIIVIITILLLSSFVYSQHSPQWIQDSIKTDNWTKYDSSAIYNAKVRFNYNDFVYLYRIYATNCHSDSISQKTRVQLNNGNYKYTVDTFHRDPDNFPAFMFFLMTGEMTVGKNYIQYK